MTLVYILVGVVGGIIGGMGMGGGTLLIPLLTIFCSVEQHLAQACNLIVFIPMSVVAVIIHAKNGLIDGKYFLWTAVPAAAIGVLSSLLCKNLGGEELKKWFGCFLLALSVYQFVSSIATAIKNKKEKEKNGK